MMASRPRWLAGRWRVTVLNMCDRDQLDLCSPASLAIQYDSHGEIAFGVPQASLNVEYGPTMMFITWTGVEEEDDVGGTESAELLDDGSL